MADTVSNPLRTGYRVALVAGLAGFIFLFGGVFVWMASASISGAVIASGTIVVRGKPKAVQHLDGGIIKTIHVRNGEFVEAGTVLVELDETLLRANMEIYRNRLREALARKARLEAERDGADSVNFDEAFSQRYLLGEENVHHAGQLSLFDARRATRTGQISQLREKISQFGNQTDGITGVIAAKHRQLELIEEELDGIKKLHQSGYTAGVRVMAKERERAELMGQLSEHKAELARIDNAIRETEISILQIEREFQESVLSELRDVSTQVDDMVQQIIATDKQLERIAIRAPVDGVVHELSVHTVGGVVPPGGTLMQLIGVEDGVEIEVMVDPRSIDQLHIGQQAVLRFPAFNQRTTPELFGNVETISASSVVDEQSGVSFFRVEIDLPAEERQRLGDVQLVPGMPAEAHIETTARTVLSYLLKPVADQLQRALREE